MNDAYYTTTGERPDLASIEVNPPEGYIADKIMPVAPVMDKSGTIYYATVKADAAAQTSRSAGSAPTATQISDSSTTFTAAEYVKRAGIVPDEAKQMGGIEKADVVGSKWAKRQTMNALESAVATIVTGGAKDYTFDSTKFLTQSQTALQAVRLYSGASTLVGATTTLKALVQSLLADTTYGPVLSRIVSGSSPAVAAEGLSLDSWLGALKIFLGIDQVLAGDDAVWGAGDNAEKVAIMKLDNSGDELSHKWNPVFGKTFMFMPDGTQPYVIQSIADRVNVNNLYDAYIWFNCVELNSGAMKLFDGVAA